MPIEESGLEIEFENLGAVEDEMLAYAVIASRAEGKWVYCRHRERDTWEIPGGRREPGEAILDTARRELWEETGAVNFEIFPVCTYAVVREEKSYGLLCFAEVKALGPLPASEIRCIRLFDGLPKALTYPHIQPALFEKALEFIRENKL